jgi:tetratricopeptide (TPR) repeat protein
MKTYYDKQVLTAIKNFSPAPKTEATTINDAKIYELLLAKQMDAKISAEKRIEAQKICNVYLNGVVLCRKKAVAESKQAFIKGDNLFASITDADQAAIINLYRLSGWAYYYFCTGDYQTAESNLLQGLKESAILEANGLNLLIYRRIEQVINLINIYFAQKDYVKAVDACRRMSFILLKNTHYDCFGGSWSNDKLDAVPYLKEMMLNIAFKLIIKKNMECRGNKKYGEAYFYCNVYSHLNNFEVNSYNKFVIRQWLNIKQQAIAKGNSKNYKKAKLDFLADKDLSTDYDTFKASVLVQVLSESNYLNTFGFIDGTVKSYINKLALSSSEKRMLVN